MLCWSCSVLDGVAGTEGTCSVTACETARFCPQGPSVGPYFIITDHRKQHDIKGDLRSSEPFRGYILLDSHIF